MKTIKFSDVKGNLLPQSFNFIQATDPALNPANNVQAKHTWMDMTMADVDATCRLNIRNDTNTDWRTL